MAIGKPSQRCAGVQIEDQQLKDQRLGLFRLLSPGEALSFTLTAVQSPYPPPCT